MDSLKKFFPFSVLVLITVGKQSKLPVAPKLIAKFSDTKNLILAPALNPIFIFEEFFTVNSIFASFLIHSTDKPLYSALAFSSLLIKLGSISIRFAAFQSLFTFVISTH